MRFNEFIPEQELDEGPVGQAIGKGVGAAAKGLGAVAGGVRGAWDAAKQGFQAGRDVVAGKKPAAPAADDEQEPATTAQDINKQGPAGTAPAKNQTGAAAAAIQKTAQATQNASPEQAGQTVYAQVKSQINQLDKKGKQRIMQLLQKSLQQPAAAPQQAAKAATPAGKTGPNWDAETGEPLTPKAKAEYASFSPELKAEIQKNIENKKNSTAKQSVAASQAEIDADRNRLIPSTGESQERLQKKLAESLRRLAN